MTFTSSTRHGRAAAALGAALAAFALVLLGAVPATAHTELVRVSPADGERVETDAPLTVSLTFSEAIDPALADVVVVDAQGETAAARTVVDDAIVTHVLRDVPGPGPYVIRYRVVSGDGHPVTGESRFEVAAAQPTPSAEPTTGAEPGATPPGQPESEAADPTASGGPAEPPTETETAPASAASDGTEGSGRTSLLLAAGAVALLLMAGAALANRRRTRASA